eukprot:TRINITY_DN20573_c0_g1_i1.p1 TRINITY_DN20573_c0_g1~~TRINITY_DN20573_c0_g1_i1.p1  ORF type:complete len:381 (-),score=46.60 TRINITY_DN20573_c0_g1_i1:224-1273(-)
MFASNCRHCAPSGAAFGSRRGAAFGSTRGASRYVVSNAAADGDGRRTNVGEYCSLDAAGKKSERTLGEKEADFLDALAAYYYDSEESKLNDEEFDNLKEELLWSGSKVAILSSAEQRFLEAARAYANGKPFLSDDEFDELKAELRAKNSIVTAAGPRCSIRSKRVFSDAVPDYLKMTLLNLPAALLVLGALFSVDDITGFEITKVIELPPPYSILFLWGVVFPSVYVIATSITNVVLPDHLILRADCPNCGTNNQAYFGGIFSVSGNTKTAATECKNCLADLEFNSIKREVVITTSAEEKQAQAEEAAKKKAASAAKKAAKAKANSSQAMYCTAERQLSLRRCLQPIAA